MDAGKEITVVVTSSNRHDLLERTLDSFFRYNTYPRIKRVIISEDSSRYPHFIEESGKYTACPVYILGHRPRLGQLLSIDVAYKYVDTEYIFHCEDDWEFYAPGFIETSFPILDSSPHILQVHLRRPDDVFPMGKLTCATDPSRKFTIIEKGESPVGDWYGFSFNPGLRRLSDYKALGSYSGQLLTSRYTGQHYEAFIGELYHELGYAAAISLFNNGQGFVRHLGQGRHVA